MEPKNVFQSTTTRAVGVAGLITGVVVWGLREWLGIDLDTNTQNAVTVVIIAVVTPLLSRGMKKMGLPGFSSVAMLLIPALVLSSGCATGRVQTFDRVYSETQPGVLLNETEAVAKWSARNGAQAEQVANDAVLKITTEAGDQWDFGVGQTASGIVTPDTTGTVATVAGQSIGAFLNAQTQQNADELEFRLQRIEAYLRSLEGVVDNFMPSLPVPLPEVIIPEP